MFCWYKNPLFCRFPSRPWQVHRGTESDPELRGASGTSGAVPRGERPKRDVARVERQEDGRIH